MQELELQDVGNSGCLINIITCIYICEHMHVYTYVYVYVYTYICMYVCFIYVCIYIVIYIYICVCVSIHVYVYIYICSYTCIYIYRYMCVSICLYIYILEFGICSMKESIPRSSSNSDRPPFFLGQNLPNPGENLPRSCTSVEENIYDGNEEINLGKL